MAQDRSRRKAFRTRLDRVQQSLLGLGDLVKAMLLAVNCCRISVNFQFSSHSVESPLVLSILISVELMLSCLSALLNVAVLSELR